MLGFYDKLQQKKEIYLKHMMLEARKYDNVVIYGAGRVAKPIVHKLEEEQIKINVFAVSNSEINDKEFLGIPVKQIEEINLPKNNTLIIIAVKYVWAHEVLKKIQEND